MDMGAMTLRLDGMLVPVFTGGKSRKAKLTIERDGSLQLKAAPDVERAELEQFLASKRDWIYRKLADKEALTPNLSPKNSSTARATLPRP